MLPLALKMLLHMHECKTTQTYRLEKRSEIPNTTKRYPTCQTHAENTFKYLPLFIQQKKGSLQTYNYAYGLHQKYIVHVIYDYDVHRLSSNTRCQLSSVLGITVMVIVDRDDESLYFLNWPNGCW